MAFSDMTLFSAMKTKFSWLTQRQDVLARNIANADSPGYRARDLKPFDFKKFIRSQENNIRLVATSPRHIGARGAPNDFNAGKERNPYETAPAGNSVILEEQMQKVNETTVTHRMITELYRKQIGLFRMAVDR